MTRKPTRISNSSVERHNLTIRMQQCRFTRLTNGFSKKPENHAAAAALYVAHCNLCRVQRALRITPVMAIGVAEPQPQKEEKRAGKRTAKQAA